jgi:DNA-binding NarL/FixJ family response regulator
MAKPKAGPASEPSMKILIADDHWVVRESLKQVTKQLSRNFEPIEASDFKEAMEILKQHQTIGLMLIDLIMPGFGEFEGLRQLRSKYPEIPIVIISIHDDPEYVLQAIGHGVIGYIPKSAGAEEIIRALTRVISGEVSFPRHIIERSSADAPRGFGRRTQADEGVDLDILTSRERGILALIGAGTPVAKIAMKLAISPQTVRVHLGNAMRKLDLKNREETIHFAVNHVRLLAGS